MVDPNPDTQTQKRSHETRANLLKTLAGRQGFEPRYAAPESGQKFLSYWFAMEIPAPCLTVLHGFRRLTLPSCCQVLRLARVCGSVRAPRAGSDPGREGRFSGRILRVRSNRPDGWLASTHIRETFQSMRRSLEVFSVNEFVLRRN